MMVRISLLRRAVLVLLISFALIGMTVNLLWNERLLVHVVDLLNLPAIYIPDITCRQCNDFRFDYVINNSLVCSSRAAVDLLFIVTSSIAATKKRNAIRDTWGSVTSHNGRDVMTLFIVGSHDARHNRVEAQKRIAREQRDHGDMIQVQLLDSYTNLTLKTGSALHWTVTYCPKAKFIVKSDDDSFNIPQAFVERLGRSGGFSAAETSDLAMVAGICSSGNMPKRDPDHKWYDPVESYPGSYYPLHVKGRAYLMSRAAVPKLLTSANDVTFNTMEDVFWTGTVRVAARIPCLCYTGFQYKSERKDLGPCDFPDLINIHYVDAIRMRSYWQSYQGLLDGPKCEWTLFPATDGVGSVLVISTVLGSIAVATAYVALHCKQKCLHQQRSPRIL